MLERPAFGLWVRIAPIFLIAPSHGTPRQLLELLAREIAVDFRDAHSLLAAGSASEHLSLVPEVTEIVIRRAPCWGRELSAIRAGQWFVICAKTSQSRLILHVSYPH